ncbi:Limonene hydroxylase [Enhygromyxa salina]|uniref:Limonene hydroxylase n=1 Tax=Enhygromyxa salina TaxID=215803 RepID=A0A2S9YG79_9BACT|nr:helix-turn-helix domain-containing protein [Enhygromyxa salina]PRQ04110.1 Limonene hydroxylase [Enhygromyxa salina]
MPNDRISDRPTRPPRAKATPSSRSVAGARLRERPPVFLGRSAATLAVMEQVHQAVHSRGPILLVGAAGTGKHTVARLLHHFGGGEIPTLERVTLDAFGQLGRVGEFAYLSPLEHLSTERQAQLPCEPDHGRLILGTRLDPDSAEGKARLSPKVIRRCRVRIDLPLLSERIEDLEALVLEMIQTTPVTRPVCGISDDALDCLYDYDWPGNVTELREVILRALARGTGAEIELQDLPSALRLRDVARIHGVSPKQQFSLAWAERRAVEQAMRLARYNKRRAARLLEIGKSTLYRKLRQYGYEL